MITTGEKVLIRDRKLSDARDDYKWKLDPELTELDAAPRLAFSYAQFLLEYTTEIHSDGPDRSFSIDTLDGKHIGHCGYYNIQEEKKEAEVGITIADRDYWSKGYGTDTIMILVGYLFCETDFKRLFLKSLDWNIRAHKSFRKCGFVEYEKMTKDGLDFILMELTKEQWEQRQKEKKEEN